MLGGAMWDLGGTWLSYSIGVLWGGVLIVALLCAPEAEFFASPHEQGAARARFRARDVWPRFSDYWASLMLLAVPAIALSLTIMAMRNSTYSVQTSVYVVYLRQVGLVGTTIGFLFSAAEIASGFGALFAGRAIGLGNAQRTMLSGTAISIPLIALTPFLGGIQARAAGRHQQGAVVGLRQTGQRFTSIAVPPVMGMIADRSGANASFLILGSVMLLLCIPLALIIRRVERRRSLNDTLAGATD
jgi:hypothetical protein